MSEPTTLAARLARFAIRTPQENLQCPSREIVHLSMIDFIAVARAGADEPVARIAREMVLAEEGRADSSLCLLYTSPSPRDLSTSRMPSSA